MYVLGPSVQVTQRYLEYLVSQRRFDEAALACARLLKVLCAPIVPMPVFQFPAG